MISNFGHLHPWIMFSLSNSTFPFSTKSTCMLFSFHKDPPAIARGTRSGRKFASLLGNLEYKFAAVELFWKFDIVKIEERRVFCLISSEWQNLSKCCCFSCKIFIQWSEQSFYLVEKKTSFHKSKDSWNWPNIVISLLIRFRTIKYIDLFGSFCLQSFRKLRICSHLWWFIMKLGFCFLVFWTWVLYKGFPVKPCPLQKFVL